MITREQAAQMAADVLSAKSESGAYDIHHVVRLDEIRGRRPIPDYGVDRGIFEDNWIVYMAPKAFVGLTASTIMVLDQETGQLLYFGSAHDEG